MILTKLPTVLLFIGLCQLAGIVGSIFTISEVPTWYTQLNKPTFSPPAVIFGPVWVTLYTLMGVSVYLIWKKRKQYEAARGVRVFWVHLFLNFIWTPVFFGLKNIPLALIIIALVWFLILYMVKTFYPIDKYASWLLLPYLAWVSFAGVLNYYLLILN